MRILYILVANIVVVFLVDAFNRRRLVHLRQSGLYPPAGQGSDAEVERLVALSRKIDAIKLYREIHGTDLKTAKEAVDKIAKNPGFGAL